MATAQNGWPVIPNTDAGRTKLTDLILPGKMTHNVRVLSGDVATIAAWHVAEYHKRVEPIKPAGCWGWNVRKIGNGPDWSNHSAACAWDLNAPDNPDGVEPEEVMTASQIEECHQLERESGGVLRWGGDWTDADPMHWEIIGDRIETAIFARQIRGEAMTPAERTALIQALLNWDLGKPGGKDTVGIALQSGLADGKEALKRINALETKVDELIALVKAVN